MRGLGEPEASFPRSLCSAKSVYPEFGNSTARIKSLQSQHESTYIFGVFVCVCVCLCYACVQYVCGKEREWKEGGGMGGRLGN